MAKGNAAEINNALPPALEKLRNELESVSGAKAALIKRKAFLAKIRAIRNAHMARSGQIFFRRNKSGMLVFSKSAGKNLISSLFMN
jgi:hypothetical protein